MTDLLIRNVDEAAVAAIDSLAERLGISRAELLRRETENLARRVGEPVTRADLKRSAEIFADALDDDVMAQAW
ncbi:MAG: ribbon-helix-helix protein, CopG family [Arachnia sp.]